MIRTLLPLFAFLLAPLSFGATPAKTEIVMGFNPAENSEVVEVNGKLFAEYFKAKTGISVKTFAASDYTALIEAMRSGRIDFAFMPVFSFVKAEQMAGAVVLLKAVRKGRSHVYSAIITRTDKGYTKIEDLKGKNMAWVDPASASGHVFPKATLMAVKKIDPDKFFGKQVFAGSHDALLLSVLNGTVDAGATFSNTADGSEGAWTQLLKGEDVKKIKPIFITEPMASDTVSTTKKLMSEHPELVKKTVELFKAMGNDTEGRKILTALYRIDSMIDAKSAEFEPVRKAARAIDALK